MFSSSLSLGSGGWGEERRSPSSTSLHKVTDRCQIMMNFKTVAAIKLLDAVFVDKRVSCSLLFPDSVIEYSEVNLILKDMVNLETC